jgi:hypothetical protein
MPRQGDDDDIYVDANGCPVERVVVNGQEVIVHYDNIPESDITSIAGIRCTTPLRTVIDIAPQTEGEELEQIVKDCLGRRLFSREDALARIAAADMLSRPGALLLGRVLARMDGHPVRGTPSV